MDKWTNTSWELRSQCQESAVVAEMVSKMLVEKQQFNSNENRPKMQKNYKKEFFRYIQ